MRNQTRFTLWVLSLAAGISLTAYAADVKSVSIVLTDGHRQTYALADINRIDFKEGAVIVFKDGHEKSFSLSEVSRIEFSPASADSQFGRNHFLGKWRVGDGAGSHFYITLEPDGQARKTLGSSRGTWTLVDGEARISWDDGWHDVIRKAGAKHEKRAYEPGRSFNDEPSNVTEAHNMEPKSI